MTSTLQMPAKRRLRRLSVLLVALAAGALWALSANERGKLLHEAAWNGDSSTVKILILLGIDVNYSTGTGTGLHGAAWRGDLQTMQYLLEHEAYIDSRDKYGVTPLWVARAEKNFEAEQLLLLHGANPDTSGMHAPCRAQLLRPGIKCSSSQFIG